MSPGGILHATIFSKSGSHEAYRVRSTCSRSWRRCFDPGAESPPGKADGPASSSQRRSVGHRRRHGNQRACRPRISRGPQQEGFVAGYRSHRRPRRSFPHSGIATRRLLPAHHVDRIQAAQLHLLHNGCGAARQRREPYAYPHRRDLAERAGRWSGTDDGDRARSQHLSRERHRARRGKRERSATGDAVGRSRWRRESQLARQRERGDPDQRTPHSNHRSPASRIPQADSRQHRRAYRGRAEPFGQVRSRRNGRHHQHRSQGADRSRRQRGPQRGCCDDQSHERRHQPRLPEWRPYTVRHLRVQCRQPWHQWPQRSPALRSERGSCFLHESAHRRQ